MRITAENLVTAIAQLPRDIWFDYVSSVGTKVRIVRIEFPEGPIIIERYNAIRESSANANEASISSKMIWRVANSISENVPINVDRVLGASYNTRSALETLLVHTPEFFWCKPGRIEVIKSSTAIKEGHKHIIWKPGAPHELGIAPKLNVEQTISELPAHAAVYDALTSVDINVDRRHLQIQIALIEIGRQLGFRTWIAYNDQGYRYGEKKIGELDGVISDLRRENLMAGFQECAKAAWLIDCIWFRENRFMPAVMEVEHSTGVKSGLTRMKNLYDLMPPISTRWVIVAPDEDREKVLRDANMPQFKDLRPLFLPYSSVDELFSFCQRRNLNPDAVNDAFLDCFMEPCVN